jgi:hypothetical protein
MSALGQKQAFAPQKVMSALPRKADMCSAARDVCFGPIADIPASQRNVRFAPESGHSYIAVGFGFGGIRY